MQAFTRPTCCICPFCLGLRSCWPLVGLIRINPLRLKGLDNHRLFIIGWFLVTFALIYLPVDYQIHLLNGWQVPMAILAVTAVFEVLVPWAMKTSRGLAVAEA